MRWSVLWILVAAIVVVIGEDSQFTKANNQFASSAYKEVLKQHNGNFLLSPLSAETILALAQSGSKGETGQEIRKALHLPDDAEEVEKALKEVLPQVKGGDQYSLHSANKMYIQDNFPVKEKFKKSAQEVYQAEAENIDFSKKEEATAKMNSWVEKETNGKINNLVDANHLTNRSRVVLLNGLYFKADWETPFHLSDTDKRKFYRSESDVVEVDTMYHMAVPAFHNYFKYFECPHLNAKLLELPFKGGEVSMTIVLPNDKEGLAALEGHLDMVFTPHNLTLQFVNVAIPKFKIETKIDLKQTLQSLGVRSAFHKDLADLSGISGEKGDLIINEVVQKSFIDVSEEGVEAAAATYVLVAVPMSGFTTPPKKFIADHPFIFYIKVKGLIVFAGRVTDPK